VQDKCNGLVAKYCNKIIFNSKNPIDAQEDIGETEDKKMAVLL